MKLWRRKLALGVVIVLADLCIWSVGMERIATWLAPVGVLLLVALLWPASSKPVPLRLSLAFVTTCATILVADGALRLFYSDHLYYRPYERLVHRWPPDAMQTRLRPGTRIEVVAHGDLAAMTGVAAHRVRRRIRFQTGPRGFRNGPPAERPIDLVLLGDSSLMGCGTTEGEILGAELERLGGYSLHSLAIPSGPWEQLMILKSELPRLDLADGATVLWGLFAGNDLDDTCRARLEPSSDGFLDRLGVRYSTFRRRSPLRQLTREGVHLGPDYVTLATRSAGQPVLFYRPHVARSQRTVSDVEAHFNHTAVKAVFHELLRFVRQRELKMVVFTIPSKPQVYPWLLGVPSVPPDAFSVVVGRWCAAQNVAFLALQPHFDRVAKARFDESGQMFWWRDDTHWNGSGHALAARVVHEQLLSK